MAARVLLLLLLTVSAVTAQTAEERAIAYLAGEVPQWSQQNHCFSCHNNGDAARALYTARRLGFQVPAESLAETTRWLIRPREWDSNRGDPAFSDKKLARIQFAASLAEAARAGLVKDRTPLVEAAQSLLAHQETDGSWPVDAGAAVGSPVTYGATLATYLSRATLEAAGASRFQAAIAKADRWLLASRAGNILDASALLLALGGRNGPSVQDKRRQCVEMILSGQASDGGWGPHRGSPPEPFDTAMVLLALRTVDDGPEMQKRIAQGRAFLERAQLPSGGWTETTRPPGARSYAQHISTSGWATLALLETRR